MFENRERFHAGGEWMSNGHHSDSYRPRPWPPIVSSQQAALPVAPANRLDAIRVATAHALPQTYCPAELER